MDKLKHFNIISSITTDDLTPFYETVDNNEIIEFVTPEGIHRSVNSLTIWTDSSALYIELNDSSYCVYIPANSFISIDYLLLKSIKVKANAGAKLRYLAMYY